MSIDTGMSGNLYKGHQRVLSEGEKMENKDLFSPSPALLSMLGTIVLYAKDSLNSPKFTFEITTMVTLLNDPEVVNWLSEMRRLGHIK